MNSIVLSLNPSQRRAVDHPGGPLLVVAGPGTGKTRTLTCRIAELISLRGAAPRSVLALTFTNRAAGEMRGRLESLLAGRCGAPSPTGEVSERSVSPPPDPLQSMFIGTFHALGLLVVRENWAYLGFETEPVLYDEEDRRTLIREILATSGGKKGRKAVDEFVEALRHADTGRGLERDACGSRDSAIRRYGAAKRAEGAVDFDDLIRLPLVLFESRPELLAAYRRRWRHILVDEYQDVDDAQVSLVKHMADDADSLTAIGDPDQAIYSFRGSDPAHFLRFAEDFPGAEILHLHDNYRSTVTILSASDQIIRGRDRGHGTPAARARGGRGLCLEVRSLATDRAEATFVSRRIEEMAGGIGRFGLEDPVRAKPEAEEASGAEKGRTEGGGEYGFGDIAVLYRLNAQARALGEALDRGGIPYQRVGTGRAAADPAARAVLALARLALRSGDRAARRTLASMGMKEREIANALFQVPGEPRDGLLLRAGGFLAAALPGKAPVLKSAAAELSRRAMEEDCGMIDFVSAAPLVYREDPFAARSEKVTLSTLHAAKGLEFPVVFVTGMEDGLIPYLREGDTDPSASRDEERRLLYVGMTRARERLVLTSARRRFLFGKTVERGVSPFLREISGDLVRFVRESRPGKRRRRDEKQGGQKSLF